MTWDRALWGVEFTSYDESMLIGRVWAQELASSATYPGEPTRALLFTTREFARRWCAEKMRGWRDNGDSTVRRWRVRPVRVRETVQVAAPNVMYTSRA